MNDERDQDSEPTTTESCDDSLRRIALAQVRLFDLLNKAAAEELRRSLSAVESDGPKID